MSMTNTWAVVRWAAFGGVGDGVVWTMSLGFLTMRVHRAASFGVRDAALVVEAIQLDLGRLGFLLVAFRDGSLGLLIARIEGPPLFSLKALSLGRLAPVERARLAIGAEVAKVVARRFLLVFRVET
jgi:hypothetical protein